MICGLKSLTLADSEGLTVECHNFESEGWHEVNVAFKFYQI